MGRERGLRGLHETGADRTRMRVLVLAGALTLACMVCAAIVTDRLSWRWSFQVERARVEHVALHYFQDLVSDLGERLALLSTSPLVRQSLENQAPADSAGLQSLLDTSRLLLEAAVTCLLDSRGRIIAVSSHPRQDRLLGGDCSARGYFRQAMGGEPGAGLGLDPFTGQRGLFLSHPVKPGPDGKPIGAAVTMLCLEGLDTRLHQHAEPLVLVSPAGVVFAGNMPGWLFKQSAMHGATPAGPPDSPDGLTVQAAGRLGLDLAGPLVRWNGREHLTARVELARPRGWSLVGLAPFSRPWGLILLAVGALAVIGALAAWLILANLRHREAERARAVSEERFRSAFEQAAVGMAHLTPAGVIRRINLRTGLIWGIEPDKAQGLRLEQLVRDRDRAQVRGLLECDTPQGDRCQSGEVEVRRGDGGKVWCQLTVSPVNPPGSGETYFLLVVEDITRRRQAEDRAKLLARFPDDNPNPVLRLDPQGRVVYTNPACESMLGRDICRPGETAPEQILSQLRNPPTPTGHWSLELEVNGSIFDFSVLTLRDTGEYYLYGVDVTERNYLQRQQALALKVFENAAEGIVIADQDARVQMVNPAFTAITGYQADEVVGRRMDVLRADAMPGQFYEQVWDDLVHRGQWTGEYLNRRKSGEAYPEWLTINILRDEKGRPANYLAVFYDITEFKRGHELIRYQAHHDALTGLPNRVLFQDRVHQALAHADRHHLQAAVLFLDLDEFKAVNDTLGHDQGDRLLQEVADRLQSCVRGQDTVARLGGDEFVMILQELSGEAGAARVAGEILEALGKPFELAGRSVTVSASVGVAFYPNDGVDPEELLSAADLAMYRAKQGGRNNYQLFTPGMQQESATRLEVEKALDRALRRGEFQVHYQPLAELASGRISGMEALVRWLRPGPELVHPDRFIGIAEESGLILPLGEWVLRRACEQARQWRDRGYPDLRLSVNISARQFRHPGLAGMVGQVLEQTGLPPEGLELEIKEAALMGQVEDGLAVLRELAGLGLRLAVDDFGTGYSSLFYLKHFPVHTVKVDKAFIADLEQGDRTGAIVRSIVSLSHGLGLSVVAEGVETPRQLALLREMGCDRMQGYIFSRPLPAEDCLDLLARDHRLPRETASHSGRGGAAAS